MKDDFSEKERRILNLLLNGKTNRQIATEMNISEFTARDYVSSLLAKTKCSNRTTLALHWANKLNNLLRL